MTQVYYLYQTVRNWQREKKASQSYRPLSSHQPIPTFLTVWRTERAISKTIEALHCGTKPKRISGKDE
jgi:hypothetical protein